MGRLHHDERLIDLAGFVKVETERAWLFFDGTLEAWVPKSQSEWDAETKTLTMPEWLARDKGFI